MNDNQIQTGALTQSAPFIFAIDIASTCGCCDGRPGEVPRFWSWDTRDAGGERADRLAYLGNFLEAYFKETTVNEVWYEAPMGLAAMMQMGSAEGVVMFLRGAIGVVEERSAQAGIPIIKSVEVRAIRKLVLHRIKFDNRNEGKGCLFQALKGIGWNPETYDQSDAGGVWLHAATLAAGSNPALKGVPVFSELDSERAISIALREIRAKGKTK